MIVKDAMVYMSAIGFLISVFPIFVYNYVYVNTEEKFASINVSLFRYLRIFNINTVKNKPNKMQVNGKDKGVSLDFIKLNIYLVLNKLCIYKVIQLSDFGIKSESNSYAVLAHHAATLILYELLKKEKSVAKLKNYTVLNEEHSHVRYYAKAVTIINLLVISKIILLFILEKINEFKTKKKQRQGI